MLKKYTIAVITLLFSVYSAAAQKAVKLSPEKKIPLRSVKVQVPEKYSALLPDTLKVNLPEGYRASVYAAGGMSKPRFMNWGPDNILYLANMNSGEVLALPDRNNDHVADTSYVAANGVFGHDLVFYKGEMLVATELSVIALRDADGDGIFEKRRTLIDSIMAGKLRPPGGHTTRTIAIDEKKNKIYISVGSSCNICREEGRAVIWEFNTDGSGRRLYATGTRNCVGMEIDPTTGKIWASNNGSDHLGDDTPPEWVGTISEGAFYGYPFAYGNQQYFNFTMHDDYRQILPLTKEDSAQVKKMKMPECHIQAHMAPMALAFPAKNADPKFREGIFLACRGSYERKEPVGYKVMYLHREKDQKISGTSDFITGFIGGDGKPWARPVGLLSGKNGELYMSSDDINQFVLVVWKE